MIRTLRAEGSALTLELYCPYERAYHVRADTDDGTQQWGEAIAEEQVRHDEWCVVSGE